MQIHEPSIETYNSSQVPHLLSEQYREKWHLDRLRREFARNGYVKLPTLFTEQTFESLKREVQQLERFAKPKSFLMPGYETPRIMSTIGGTRIRKESPAFGELYCQHEIVSFVNTIVDTEIYPCLHPSEFIVANFLIGLGSTHGWHLDDPAYALIVIFEVSPAEDGGLVEFIQGWREFCANMGVSPEEKVEPTVEDACVARLVQRRYHAPGDAYLLRADQCLHRVTELRSRNARRVVINMAYEATPHPTYGHTASMLYDED